MEKRKLGKTELEIAPLVLGGNVFGWTVDDAVGFELLDAFAEAGFNAIDTADTYSRWAPGNKGGESETLIGKWLARNGNRDKMVIITKVGMDLGPGKTGLSKKRILAAVEESLKRLQTDYIDLYFSHKDDPETPLEETLGAHAELLKQGKVKAIGASNYKADRLEEALRTSEENGLPRYEVLQPQYSLVERAEFETELRPLCEAQGLGVINYWPLASGFLTGKYRSEEDLKQSARGQGVKKYMNERGFKIIAALDQVAAEHNATPAQVALAWCMARPGVTAPIASATKMEQLKDLMGSVNVHLDLDAMERLDRASAAAVSASQA